jgi:hypothetical protein
VGEATGISMGLLMAETPSEKGNRDVVYAHETKQHKHHKVNLLFQIDSFNMSNHYQISLNPLMWLLCRISKSSC